MNKPNGFARFNTDVARYAELRTKVAHHLDYLDEPHHFDAMLDMDGFVDADYDIDRDYRQGGSVRGMRVA